MLLTGFLPLDLSPPIDRRRFLQLAALSAAALAMPRAASRVWSTVAVDESPEKVVFRNLGGEWHVWKQVTWSRGRVVGPGYVGRVAAGSGARLVDDVREPGTLNDPRYGGLGAFGWQHARAGQGEWDMHGRLDASRNSGFGVSRAAVVRSAGLEPDGSGRFAIRVDFRDGWQDPVMAVTYDYRVEPRAVVCRIEARQLWRDDGAGLAFLKEPKIAASVSPVFSTVGLYAADGGLLRSVRLDRLSEPWEQTAQLYQRGRTRIRFGGPQPLDVTMLAWDGSAAHVWDGAPAGFDRWAQLAEARPYLASNGAGYCLGGRGGLRRRWEIVKRTGIPALSCLFHAWQGGTGLGDCWNASRAFGPAGETFSVVARYELPEGPNVRQKSLTS